MFIQSAIVIPDAEITEPTQQSD